MTADHRRYPGRGPGRGRVAGADVVFHLAAQVAVTTSLVSPLEDFAINLRRHPDAARGGARARGCPSSSPRPTRSTAILRTCRCGDGRRLCAGATRDRAEGIGEQRPLDFHTPYGCSKGAADQYVLDYARSFGIPTAVLRMSCIYGPRQMGTEDQGWVAHFLISALRGPADQHLRRRAAGPRHPVRRGRGDAYLAAWRAIERIAASAFNLGGGPANAVSLRQVLAQIETLVGRPVDCCFADWRAGDQRYYVSDTRRAERASACRPRCHGARAWRNSRLGSRRQRGTGASGASAQRALPLRSGRMKVALVNPRLALRQQHLFRLPRAASAARTGLQPGAPGRRPGRRR